MKNKPTLKKGIVAASVVAGVAGGLVAGLALGVPGFAGASSNGVQGASAAFAKNAVVQVADANTNTDTNTNNAPSQLPGMATVQGSSDGADHAPRGPRAAIGSDAVAKVLGLSADELKTQLQSGKSLADIAKAQNVDIAKVKQAIIDDFTARETAEVTAGEHTQAEVDQKIADLKSKIDDIVNGVKPAGMPGDMGGRMGGDHGPRGGGPIASDSVAKALGLSADELKTQLRSGKSLADIAKAQNVDVAKVKAAITADLKAHLDEEVASGEHTQAEADAKLAELTSRLDDIVNGVKPAGMPGMPGDMGGRMGGDHGPRGGHDMGPRGEHGRDDDDDNDGGPAGQGGSAPTLQGGIQVQPSGVNA